MTRANSPAEAETLSELSATWAGWAATRSPSSPADGPPRSTGSSVTAATRPMALDIPRSRSAERRAARGGHHRLRAGRGPLPRTRRPERRRPTHYVIWRQPLSSVGRTEESVAAAQRAVTSYRESGDERVEATALYALGEVLLGEEQYEEAVTAYQRTARILEEIGFPVSRRLRAPQPLPRPAGAEPVRGGRPPSYQRAATLYDGDRRRATRLGPEQLPPRRHAHPDAAPVRGGRHRLPAGRHRIRRSRRPDAPTPRTAQPRQGTQAGRPPRPGRRRRSFGPSPWTTVAVAAPARAKGCSSTAWTWQRPGDTTSPSPCSGGTSPPARRPETGAEKARASLTLGVLLVDTGQYVEGIRVSQRAADCLAMEGDAQRRSIALSQLEKARRGLRGLGGGPTSIV